MRLNIILLLVLISGCATSKKQVETTNTFATASNTVLVDYIHFQIAYNPEKRLADYVTYELSAEKLKTKKAKRTNKFIADPLLIEKKLPYVTPAEYTKSGYDRGHLAPSADFAWDQEVNDTTFVMSNMVPQTPNLNRDAWRRLEDKVRQWACGEGKITVITGPVFTSQDSRLKSGLIVPQKFFKIIIDETPPKKSLTFLYDQSDKGDVLLKRIVPVENVETMTGIAFNKNYPELKNNRSRVPASINTWKEADCD